MELQDLVGKKAVRTQSIWYDSNDRPVDADTAEGELSEDDSFTGGNYITINAVSEERVYFTQHFFDGQKVNIQKEFNFNDKYDQGFLDNNWKEYKEGN